MSDSSVLGRIAMVFLYENAASCAVVHFKFTGAIFAVRPGTLLPDIMC